MSSRAEFIEFVSEQVKTQWEKERRPLLLSHIPTLWAGKAHVSYKDLIGGLTLKAFVGEVAVDDGVGFKLVSNPNVPALVGLIPRHESYEFAPRPAVVPKVPASRASSVVPAGSNEQVVRDFLALLAKLPPEDVQKVVIPVEILTQLMFEK